MKKKIVCHFVMFSVPVDHREKKRKDRQIPGSWKVEEGESKANINCSWKDSKMSGKDTGGSVDQRKNRCLLDHRTDKIVENI